MDTYIKNFSDEEIAGDWTLSKSDLDHLQSVSKIYQLYVAIQICSIRLVGSFFDSVQTLSLHIINYLNFQIGLPPTLFVNEPTWRATRSEYHGQILTYLGFKKYDQKIHEEFEEWVTKKAIEGLVPEDILNLAEEYLLRKKIVLPGITTLERPIRSLCLEAHARIFETICEQISPQLKKALDDILVAEDNKSSFFAKLKESPPFATITSLKTYLKRYRKLEEITLEHFDLSQFSSSFTDYLFRLAKYYNASKIKRFNKHKRLTMLICFLLEVRKELLDNIVKMHNQYILDISRKTKNLYEKKHRQIRKKNKKAVETMLTAVKMLLDPQSDTSLDRKEIIESIG